VRHAGECSPLTFKPPYRLRREFKLESYADEFMRRALPNARRLDSRTIEVTSNNLFDLI
jgi:D-aminopeptidase